ncbi:MAG TPA: hypothetical protein VFB79_08935, partial [Candidatus Angelobacter sp.]|nr:hypothetical protein [Candidatus Angelobacter sp.]
MPNIAKIENRKPEPSIWAMIGSSGIAADLLICLLFAVLSVSANAAPAKPWRVQFEPAQIVNGSP